ncbi:MAG: hypothetical protein DSY90_02945 [Deltaproteobacteria bacterium]|nr:MAG: hypothetical protein DSY90_02945 [Deltaproteobacteria bacterium]
MHIYGAKQLQEDVFGQDLCIGCGACIDLCPYFKSHNGKTTLVFPCDLSEGRCYAYCPKAEVDLDELSRQAWDGPYTGRSLGNFREIIATRAGKKMSNGNFQAGGTVSSLVASALKHHRIDAAILTDRDGLKPVPRRVTDWREVVRCAGSKLMVSPTLAAMNHGLRDGFSCLGVVGTPCQMTAVAKMRGNPMSKENFADPIALTIGLFCNWSLDARQLASFLSEKTDVSGIRGMDIPPPPANVMVIETGNGQLEIPLSEIKPLIPPTCFICLDMTSEWADVSVGMFEGRPGWNTLIIRSEKGAELVQQARDAGFLETGGMPVDTHMHLSNAALEKKQRSLRTLIRRELINNNNDKRSALRVAPGIVQKILGSKTERP